MSIEQVLLLVMGDGMKLTVVGVFIGLFELIFINYYYYNYFIFIESSL